jgi:hypothetical protein
MSFFHFDIEKDLGNLPMNAYNDDNLCRVELYLDYTDPWLIVSFSARLKNSWLKDQQVRHTIMVTPIEDYGYSVLSFTEYACSEDGCEKMFIMDHIQWLLRANYTEFQTNVISLITDDGIEPGK